MQVHTASLEGQAHGRGASERALVLFGMKLVGTCIWRSDKGHLFVTLPAKPGKEGRHFEYLGPARTGSGTPGTLKEEILRQWEASRVAEASVVRVIQGPERAASALEVRGINT